MLFRELFPDHPFTLGPSLAPDLSEMNIIGMDDILIPYQCGSILEWLSSFISTMLKLVSMDIKLSQAYLWAPCEFIPLQLSPAINAILASQTLKLELLC